MTSNSLGTLYIDLDLRNNLSSGLSSAQSQLGSVGSTLTSAGAGLTKNVTAPLTALGGVAMYTAVQFDDSMRKVKAISGANADEFENLTEQARELGRTTRYTASEAAEGMTYLAMAGFEVDEVMQTMPDMLNLAAASATDLGTTADIASNILTGFSMDASEMGRAADVMALAVSSSNTDLTQLGEAMSYAAPVANAFGMSIEESAAAVGFLSNAGIQASMAGTTLRGMLTRLSDPSGEAAEALEGYGIALEDVNPEIHSFTEILKVLNDAGVSTSDMMMLMGQRAGPGTAALLSQGYENLETYTEALENADGTAAQMAETMESGPGGASRRLKSALESVAITLGDTLANAVLPFVEGLTTIATGLSEFGEAHPTLLKIGVVLGVVAAAAGPVLMVVGMMASGIGAITGVLGAVGGTAGLLGGLSTLAGVLATIAGPALMVVGAVGLIWYAFKNWDKIKEIAGNVYAWVKDGFTKMTEYLTGVDLSDEGTGIIKKLGAGILVAVGGIPLMIAKLISNIIEQFTGVDLYDEGVNLVTKYGKGILLGIAAPPLMMATMINEIIKKITGVDMFSVGYQFIDKLSGGILSKLGELLGKVKSKWAEMTNVFSDDSEEPTPTKSQPASLTDVSPMASSWVPTSTTEYGSYGDTEILADEVIFSDYTGGELDSLESTAWATPQMQPAAVTYEGDTYNIGPNTFNGEADIDYLMAEIDKRTAARRVQRGIRS